MIRAALCAALIVASSLAYASPLQDLKDGNKRFVAGKPEACTNAPERRSQLTTTQAPEAVVLSCSDSRVPPEQIFDQGLGRIFTVRLAGNVLNTEAIASIEYAVAKLGSRLIVVLGHESCGAVDAAIHTPAGEDAGSPSLNQLLSDIRENIGNKSSKVSLDAAIKKNISAVAKSLTLRSPLLHNAVKSGKLQIVTATYELGSGRVDFWSSIL